MTRVRGPFPGVVAGLVFLLVVWAGWSTFQFVQKPFPGFRIGPTSTLTSGGLPEWNGYREGMAEEDVVEGVAGKPLESSADIWTRVRAASPGTLLIYDVWRGTSSRSVTVRTSVYTLHDWIWSNFPFGLVAAIFLAIGAIGYRLKPEHPAARAHLYFTAAVGACLALGMDYDFGGRLACLYVASLYAVGSATLHLALEFPVRARLVEGRPWVVRVAYLPTILLGAISVFAFKAVPPSRNPAYGLFQGLFAGASSWFLLCVAALLAALLLRSIRPPTPKAAHQARVALYGVALATLPIIAVSTIPAVFRWDASASAVVAPAILASSLMGPASVAYAIVRTHLFDIDLVIKRTLQYAGLLGSLGALYFATLVTAGYFLQRIVPGGDNVIPNALAAGVMAFAFGPMSHRTKQWVDQAFSRRGYDSTKVLLAFGEAARRVAEPSALFEAVRAALDASIQPCGVALSVPGLGDYAAGTSAAAEALPLLAGEEVIGGLRVGPRLSDQDFSAQDREFLAALARQVALAAENLKLIEVVRSQDRIAQEVRIAHDVQAGLLPARLPEIPGARVAAHYQVALEMGGDFYDVIPLPDGQVGLAVGDISGKGVASSLLAAVCISFFRAVAPRYADPVAALSAVGELFYEHRGSKKMFAAVTYVAYDPATGRVVGVNAGNPAPLLDGEPIEAKGLPLGSARKLNHKPFELELAPGCTLVLVSDGFTDARNAGGERFGDERLAALTAAGRGAPPSDLVVALRDGLAAFQPEGRLYDDLTVVALMRDAPTRF
jgi:serine phosphatase RsbU (regulator of sigma subunit)